jgi:hypothetical protein
MKNEIEIEILEDGTIKFTTGEFSDAKHVPADDFLLEVAEALGGPSRRDPRSKTNAFNRKVLRHSKKLKAKSR